MKFVEWQNQVWGTRYPVELVCLVEKLLRSVWENERAGIILVLKSDVLEFKRSHMHLTGPPVEPYFAQNEYSIFMFTTISKWKWLSTLKVAVSAGAYNMWTTYHGYTYVIVTCPYLECMRCMVECSLAGQTLEEGRECLVTVVYYPCARGISLTASLTCCHETNEIIT